MGNISQLDKHQCFGCWSCYNKCPVKAISMVENEEGFLYPIVNEDKCIKCGFCLLACPICSSKDTNTQNPKCFALMAEDKIRNESSSGGAFTLFGDFILNLGGYVCGAAYNDDFSVSHIIIDNATDLKKLKGSKYFQSNIENCYKQIKHLLETDKYVLFTGTPCQVAGLNTYLENVKYEKLYTVELLCHGVPSYKTFRKYLEEHFDIKDVKEINFRDKALSWRSDYLSVTTSNGEIIRENTDTNSFERGFHTGLFNRLSCAPCKFAKLPRQADITIADWWGISKYDETLDDKKGTSLILINNDKGDFLFSSIKNKAKKIKEIPLSVAKKSVNKTIWKPLKHNSGRSNFFKNFNSLSVDKNVKCSLDNFFDVGIIGLWAGNNYGCILTGYALYKLIEDFKNPTEEENFSVAFIDKYHKISEIDNNTMVRRFTKNLNVFQINEKETYKLNNNFNTFIVGSDQVWNYNLTSSANRFMFLDFANSNKLKISFSSSFGNSFQTNKDKQEMEVLSHLLNKFDKVSVRENYAADELNKKTGVNAVQILDPVFVCDRKNYEDLIAQSKVNTEEDYIFAYILDPDDEKNKILEYLGKTLNLKIYVSTDATRNEKKRKKITNGTVLGEIDLQDWLKYYKNAKYIFTDSFHGTCFSIIFKKQFISLGNIQRGIKRFDSLLSDFNLTDRMFTSPEDLKQKNLLEKSVNYEEVYNILDRKRNEALLWLKEALSIKKCKYINDSDLNKILISIYSKPKIYYELNYIFNKILYNLSFGNKRKTFKERSKYLHNKVRAYRKYNGFLPK